MRKDMAKVITECSRGGSSISYRDIRAKYKNEDTENLPKRMGMRKPYGWERKEFGENLNPLYRFIASCVGKKWDDVYSEICQHINKNNTSQNHILQHLYDVLEINTYVGEDGNIYCHADYGNKPDRADIQISYNRWRDKFYVCPKTNIIKKVKNIYPEKVETEDYYKLLSEKNILLKDDGIWYLVEIPENCRNKINGIIAPKMEAKTILCELSLVKEGGVGTYYDIKTYSFRRHLNKKQLSKKELKKYSLSNS